MSNSSPHTSVEAAQDNWRTPRRETVTVGPGYTIHLKAMKHPVTGDVLVGSRYECFDIGAILN